MKLKVLDDYKSHRGAYTKGKEIEVEEELGLFLQRDAPACFEVVKEKALDEPPENKMVAAAPKKKGRRR